MNAQIMLIVGIGVVLAVSFITENMLARGAADLDAETRERVWKRELLSEWWWRIPQYIAIALLAAGMAKVLGLLRGMKFSSNYYVAIGISIYCLSMCIRAWFSSRSYNAEAPGSKAGRRAFTAAIFVTVAELALAATVCGIVFGPQIKSALAGNSNTPAPGGTAGNAGNVGTDTQPEADLLWVTQEEALKLLKTQDKAYLEGLVRIEEVRIQQRDGTTRYRRDDISETKLSPESVKSRLKVLEQEAAAPDPNPAAKPPQKKDLPKAPKEEVKE